MRSVTILREAGFKVDSIQEDSPAANDISILDRAVKSGSVLLTFDRDFGDLVFNHQLPAPKGILYFRFDLLTPDEPAQMLLGLVREIEIEGNMTVITRYNIRQRELPK